MVMSMHDGLRLKTLWLVPTCAVEFASLSRTHEHTRTHTNTHENIHEHTYTNTEAFSGLFTTAARGLSYLFLPYTTESYFICF